MTEPENQDLTSTATATTAGNVKRFYKAINSLQNSAISYILKNSCEGNIHATAIHTLDNVSQILEDAANSIGREGGCQPPRVYNPETRQCEQ